MCFQLFLCASLSVVVDETCYVNTNKCIHNQRLYIYICADRGEVSSCRFATRPPASSSGNRCSGEYSSRGWASAVIASISRRGLALPLYIAALQWHACVFVLTYSSAAAPAATATLINRRWGIHFGRAAATAAAASFFGSSRVVEGGVEALRGKGLIMNAALGRTYGMYSV